MTIQHAVLSITAEGNNAEIILELTNSKRVLDGKALQFDDIEFIDECYLTVMDLILPLTFATSGFGNGA
jgi:hypothetical protein